MHKFNKFYVGAEHIGDSIADGTNDDWTHPTLEKAVEKGKTILNEDSSRECVVIVQIVRILRRAKPPIVVEKV